MEWVVVNVQNVEHPYIGKTSTVDIVDENLLMWNFEILLRRMTSDTC